MLSAGDHDLNHFAEISIYPYFLICTAHRFHLLHHWQLSSADLLLILMARAMPGLVTTVVPAMAEDRILNLTLVPRHSRTDRRLRQTFDKCC